MPHFEMGFFENNWKLFILLSKNTEKYLFVEKENVFNI